MTTRSRSISDRCAAVMAGALPCSAFGNQPEVEFHLVNEWLKTIYEVYESPEASAKDVEWVIKQAYTTLGNRVSPAYQLGFHDMLADLPMQTPAMREFYVKDMAL